MTVVPEATATFSVDRAAVEPLPRWAVALALLLVLAVTVSVRWRLLDAPLDRDEAGYALTGELMLEGVSPYELGGNLKPPGAYAGYALIVAALGRTPAAIHLGLLIINAATIVLMYLLGRAVQDRTTGIGAAATFAVLSLGEPVQGPFSNTEDFTVLPAVAGLWLLVRAVESRRWPLSALSGLLLGVAILMKQPGAAYAAFAGCYLLGLWGLRRPRDSRLLLHAVVLVLCAVTPYLLACLALWLSGAFASFWFWTVEYTRHYVSQDPLELGLRRLQNKLWPVVWSSAAVWVLALMGLVAAALPRSGLRRRGFLIALLFFAFLATVPGLYFRSHYFVLLLPAVALLAGGGAAALAQRLHGRLARPALAGVTLALLALVVGSGYLQQRRYLFQFTPQQIVRQTYRMNPFIESLEVARYLREHTDPGDRIAVLGSEPQIYFYSRRRPGTTYLYMYPLTEQQPYATEMQQDLIRQIEFGRPRYIVFVNNPLSWVVRPESDRTIFEWWEQYRPRFYRGVGIVETSDVGDIISRWDEETLGRQPGSNFWIGVFERIDQDQVH